MKLETKRNNGNNCMGKDVVRFMYIHHFGRRSQNQENEARCATTEKMKSKYNKEYC